jgi:maltose alpha-D-glucosyltransferase / alpha-amylase
LLLHNLADEPREIELATGLKDGRNDDLINLLIRDHSRAASNGKHRVCLEPYGHRWYRVGGLDHLLKRSGF